MLALPGRGRRQRWRRSRPPNDSLKTQQAANQRVLLPADLGNVEIDARLAPATELSSRRRIIRRS
jgi:hypothetical protein